MRYMVRVVTLDGTTVETEYGSNTEDCARRFADVVGKGLYQPETESRLRWFIRQTHINDIFAVVEVVEVVESAPAGDDAPNGWRTVYSVPVRETAKAVARW